MEAQPDALMALEGVEHRLIGVLEDVFYYPAEIADGLVVMHDQRQRNDGATGMDSS